ncbi:iron complex transport system ATP-binding protein [Schumannella luteola]|uniref:Iron complex transport system ATP-binding protein n=1 Tax=Schumannella luteola TaxID=472059 RepID=A0A852Y5Y7_9MICO|nr:iron complex transport system ATP-binding protein [Schumannella luteola]
MSQSRTPPRMRARGIVVRRGGRPVLDGVDLELRAGEVIALVGPNGAGKSTLLHVLAGDLVPDAGEIQLGGIPLRSLKPAAAARRRSVLTQSNEVSFPFTVDEVVRMGRAPWTGADESAHDAAEVEAAIDVAELRALRERRMPQLSGGERARAASARVRAQATTITLLDEPTASLDIRHQERLLADVRARAAAGASAVVVLHDLDLAAAWAHRVAVLAEGRIQALDVPHRALDAVLLSRVYRHPIAVHPDPLDATRLVIRPDRRAAAGAAPAAPAAPPASSPAPLPEEAFHV